MIGTQRKMPTTIGPYSGSGRLKRGTP